VCSVQLRDYVFVLLRKQVVFSTIKKILISKSEQTEQNISADQLINKYQLLHDRAKVMSEIYCIICITVYSVLVNFICHKIVSK